MENFSARHGGVAMTAVDGVVRGEAPDGSTFSVGLPWSRMHEGDASVEALVEGTTPPPDWGVLLVRRGGFAVARLAGRTILASKVGSRHVQGRTKAGGQSQQRFARRRDNQARAAYEAASTYAVQVLGVTPVVVLGGDRAGLDHVLEHPGFRDLQVVGRLLEVPGDPRRKELEAAIEQASALHITVVNV